MLLAPHFRRVAASDPSRAQVAAARRAERVHYFSGLGEASALRSRAIDLVTVAQALHWIDRDRFWPEVDRIIAPGGAVAIWTYGIFQSTPDIDEIVHRFYAEKVGSYWPKERVHVEQGYRTIDIPIEEVAAPGLEIVGHLTLPALLGFVRTWSAVGRFQAAQGHDPVHELAGELAGVWGDPAAPRRLAWPLAVRAGRWRGMGG